MDGSQRVKNQRMESIIKHLLTNQFTGNMIGDSIHEDTHRLYYNIPSVLPPIFKNTDNLNKLKPPFDPDEIYCAGLRWAALGCARRPASWGQALLLSRRSALSQYLPTQHSQNRRPPWMTGQRRNEKSSRRA